MYFSTLSRLCSIIEVITVCAANPLVSMNNCLTYAFVWLANKDVTHAHGQNVYDYSNMELILVGCGGCIWDCEVTISGL